MKSHLAFLLTVIILFGFAAPAQANDGTIPVPGYIVAWGNNSFGQRDVPVGLSGVIAIASDSLALKNDGNVVIWGDILSGCLNVPFGLTGVTAISCGSTHNLVIRTPPPWDLNGDRITDVLDMVLTGFYFDEVGEPGWSSYDINRDGKVDIPDLTILGQHLGETW